LELRFAQHQAGEGANHTQKRLPVELVYFEEFKRIDEAFYREKQVQGWSRKKKEALIKGEFDKLSDLSKNYTQFPREVVSASSTTNTISLEQLPEPVVLPEPAVLPELVEGNRKPKIDL
jgi:putative endonuclease